MKLIPYKKKKKSKKRLQNLLENENLYVHTKRETRMVEDKHGNKAILFLPEGKFAIITPPDENEKN